MITKSPKTMQKMPVCDSKTNSDNDEEKSSIFWMENSLGLMESERDFGSVVIGDLNENSRINLEKFLFIKGMKVLRLAITSTTKHRDFETVLKLVPNLKYLKLYLKFKLSESVKFNKLRALKVRGACHSILRFVEAPNLNMLEIIRFWNDESRQNLIAFLMKCPKLRRLGVNLNVTAFDLEEIGKFPFNLYELEMIGFVSNPESVEENFSKFLRQQEKSLMKIRIQPSMCPPIYLQILTRFENLQWLCVDCSELPPAAGFYSCLKPLERVRTLKIVKHGFENLETVEAFHALFPNLTSLLCMNNFHVITRRRPFIEIMEQSHKNLKVFVFPDFDKTYGNPMFMKLKALAIGKITRSGLELILKHRNLVYIYFEHADKKFPTVKDIHRILRLPNLKTIHVQGSFDGVKQFYDVLRRNYNNLSDVSFRLIGHCAPLMYQIPSDREHWDPDKGKQYFEDHALCDSHEHFRDVNSLPCSVCSIT